MNTLAKICWISSPVYLLVGMSFGIWMSATGDHTLASAHAHLNLIGGVLMALFGAFYTLVPSATQGALAKIHVVLAHLTVWTIFPGVIMAIQGQGETLAKIGAVFAVITMLVFIVQIVRVPSTRSA